LESKVFWGSEALGESNKSCRFLRFLEKIWEKPRQANLSFRKAIASLIAMNFKKRKSVKELITLRALQLILLVCSP
jgi:hypothetical protein